jgi:hypothetical protein
MISIIITIIIITIIMSITIISHILLLIIAIIYHQGEYAGLLCIKSFHESRGEGHRNVCLIPVSGMVIVMMMMMMNMMVMMMMLELHSYHINSHIISLIFTVERLYFIVIIYHYSSRHQSRFCFYVR